MSSPYPVLDDRPIDKWKVTELKEELKKRKLATRGLKEDLIKRLDEALRIERETAEESNSAAVEDDGDAAETPLAEEAAPHAGETTPTIEEATTVAGQRRAIDEALHIERETAEESNSAAGEDNRDAAETPLAEEAAPLSGETTPAIEEATPVAGQAAPAAGAAAPLTGEAAPVAIEKTPVTAEKIPVAFEKSPVTETRLVALEETPNALETTPVSGKTEDNIVGRTGQHDDKVDDNVSDASAYLDQGKDQEGSIKGDLGTVETGGMVIDSVVSEVASSEHDLREFVVEVENKDLGTQLDNGDSKLQPENESHPIDALHDSSAPNNQVSAEVNPVSGFEVKSDCISTDSVPNNENIELKDNIIADNVKLEHNVVKSEEMVEPSLVVGESHPMDVKEPHGKKAPEGDGDVNNAVNTDMSMGNDNDNVGDSEKLNLDRSSGDESMEEEVDTKQIDSNNSDVVGNKSEKSEVPGVKVEKPVDVVGVVSVAEKGALHDIKHRPGAASEKRKLLVNDQEATGNSDTVKRQRRWNSENIKVSEAHASNSTPAITPKSITPKRNSSQFDSSTIDEGPSERVVPSSQKDPTNSLRIDRFLRPFTLKAVQELLGKTGTVTSFWMDHIKTHCYVTYSSVQEAIATRSAVYNLQWPPNGGRLLLAEFVDPEEVKAKLEAPSTPTTPAAPPAPSSLPISQPKPPPRPEGSRQQPPPTALPPPPPLSNPPPIRERLPPPPPPPVADKQDPPIVTLDDLFRKTKATPRIYYLPLSEEQVAAKLAARGKGTN